MSEKSDRISNYIQYRLEFPENATYNEKYSVSANFVGDNALLLKVVTSERPDEYKLTET